MPIGFDEINKTSEEGVLNMRSKSIRYAPMMML